jgi:type I restriction enzyme S subunit
MKKYDSYKDSGIEWIGEIPNHWNISRYRYFYFSNMGVTLLKEDVKEDGIYPVYSATETDVLFGYVDEASVILNEGDIVIPARGNSIGHIKVVTSPSTSTQTTIYSKKISQNIETNFVKYFLQGLREHLFQFDRTAIPQITVNQVKNNPLVIPPPEEQIAIAAYLDRKTAEIDELIADKKRLLELYEEEKTAIINELVTGKKVWDGHAWTEPAEVKDSGIEWLGEIPEHWEVKRLKHLTSIISKGTTPSTVGKEVTSQGDVKFIKAENIVNNQVNREPENYIDNETNEILSRSELREGDILFVIAGATLGKIAILNNDFLPANTNQAISFIRLIDKSSRVFLWYYLQSLTITRIIWLNAVQSAQPNLSMENLGNFYIPYPSTEEQQSIVHHIETECALIEAKKAKTEKLIELLTEYRTALISEVVTGKVKVIE